MRSDCTANGRHKDDPTNPQSHWNDWTIDRDGNKLEEYKPNNKKIHDYTDEELQIEINKRNTKKMTDGLSMIIDGLDMLKSIGQDRDVLRDICKSYGYTITIKR